MLTRRSNASFTPFGVYSVSLKKKGFVTFLCLWKPKFMQKNKKVMSQSAKKALQMEGQREGWVELINEKNVSYKLSEDSCF